jgi:5-oxopent-3-ene-1,2,5-tricarboxylate decarboxylase/2-hydroxyhepta-2,4-diene-1,7-dioate isomerase
MKQARFVIGGRTVTGSLADDGFLIGEDGMRYDPTQVTWLPPVLPTKIVGLALNYSEHAAELAVKAPEEPAIFLKPISSLVGHLQPVRYPTGVEYMHYEVELAVVIGIRCHGVSVSNAPSVIAGYTIANDVTARDFVGDFYRPPVRAKGYDTFGPVGPYLVPADEVNDP